MRQFRGSKSSDVHYNFFVKLTFFNDLVPMCTIFMKPTVQKTPTLILVKYKYVSLIGTILSVG